MSAPTDPEVIRGKYKAERDKRVRSDGLAQYHEAKGAYARFAEEDPNAAPIVPRDPILTETEILIIGGGFAGILAGARLIEAGLKEFHIIDNAADFGGTWYWNRYPGVQCDIESYCYLPLLEETGYVPQNKHAFGDEILEYCQMIGRRYDLYKQAYFQTQVAEAKWDEQAERWIVTTDRGDRFAARFLIQGIGALSQPKLPGIPGIEQFKGKSFHTGRWDYAYTGGGLHGGLDKLKDKRVAVIGTGATGIQLIPHVAETAKQLTVFQRTPSHVGPRLNKPTDVAWYKSLGPGWQEARRNEFLEVMSAKIPDNEVADAWGDMAKIILERKPAHPETPEEMAARATLADIAVMDERRARVDAFVKDPKKAEILKAWYNMFCKRPIFNDEYLPAFNRENVDLVDVSGAAGITEINETGIVAGGKQYDVDLIVYASGFYIAGTFDKRQSFDLVGRGGVKLHEHWRKGYQTLHGLMTTKFPNYFYMGSGQNAIAPNYTVVVDDQAKHIAYIINTVNARQGRVAEVTEEAQADWVRQIRASNLRPESYHQECTPGYFNNEGGEGVTIRA
jgi:cyclohexanone monooxygenase